MALTGKDIEEVRVGMGLNQTEFAKLIDVERSRLSRYEKQTKPFSKTIEGKLRIALQNAQKSTTENSASEPLTTYRKAQAGRSVASNHRVHLRSLLAAIVDDLPEAVYDIFEVEGASMETTLTQGDKLLCRSDSIENIQDNRIYVLVTDDPTIKEYRESGVWIKRCSHRKANGYISCRSDNKDTTEPYNTFRLKTDTIKEVWYPVMKITHHMADPNRDIYDRLDDLEARIEMLEEDQD